MLRFALLAAVCFSLPIFADSISPDAVSSQQITFNGYKDGGVNSQGLFYYRAWGYVNIPYFNEKYQGTGPTKYLLHLESGVCVTSVSRR